MDPGDSRIVSFSFPYTLGIATLYSISFTSLRDAFRYCNMSGIYKKHREDQSEHYEQHPNYSAAKADLESTESQRHAEYYSKASRYAFVTSITCAGIATYAVAQQWFRTKK